jgi:hypothetical protein
MRLVALLVPIIAISVACGGSPKPAAAPPPAPDPIPKTAAPKCDVVADKLAIVIHADKPDSQAAAKAQLRARCSQDNWSEEARSCFGTVESDAELDGCKQHLDTTQKAGFAKVAPDHDAWEGAAGGAPAPAAAAPAEAPKPKAKPRTRGAQPKGDSSDPQEGGE